MQLRMGWSALTAVVLFSRICFSQLAYGKAADLDAFRASAPSDNNSLGIAVVAFCVPWYEPCKALGTELETARDHLKKWASLLLINCDEEAEACASHGILSYPAVRISQGSEERRYRGRFKAPAMISEVLQTILPPVSVADREVFEAIKASDTPLVLFTHLSGGILPGEDDVASSVAGELGSRFIVMTTDDSSLSGLQISLPHVAILSSQDDSIPVYQGDFELASVLRFVRGFSTPLFGKLDLARLTESMKSGLALGMVFAQTDAERKELAEELKDVAIRFRGTVSFATVDVEKLAFLKDAFKLDPSRYPAFVLQTREEAYTFEQNNRIVAGAIEAFIKTSLGKNGHRGEL